VLLDQKIRRREVVILSIILLSNVARINFQVYAKDRNRGAGFFFKYNP